MIKEKLIMENIRFVRQKIIKFEKKTTNKFKTKIMIFNFEAEYIPNIFAYKLKNDQIVEIKHIECIERQSY